MLSRTAWDGCRASTHCGSCTGKDQTACGERCIGRASRLLRRVNFVLSSTTHGPQPASPRNWSSAKMAVEDRKADTPVLRAAPTRPSLSRSTSLGPDGLASRPSLSQLTCSQSSPGPKKVAAGGFNVDSPAFTPSNMQAGAKKSTFSSQAASAAPFTPRGATGSKIALASFVTAP